MTKDIRTGSSGVSSEPSIRRVNTGEWGGVHLCLCHCGVGPRQRRIRGERPFSDLEPEGEGNVCACHL